MIGRNRDQQKNAMGEMMAAAQMAAGENDPRTPSMEHQLKKTQTHVPKHPHQSLTPATQLRKDRPSHDLSEHKPLSFPTQRPNERVVLLLRRHWTVLARDVSQLVLSLLLPPIIIVLLIQYTPISFATGTAPYVIIVAGLSLYYLFSFLAYFHDFVDYHLDIWVVTDQRIVSIEQEGLFHRTVSELNIVKVQDVTSEIAGKVQTFLNYGQVHIQTAGEHGRFLFEQVPNPSEVAKVILQVHDRTMKVQDLQKIKEQEDYRQQVDYGAQVEQQPPLPQNASYNQQPQQVARQIDPNIPPTSQAPMQVRRVAQPTAQPYTQPEAPQYPQQPTVPAPYPAPQPIPRVGDPSSPATVPPLYGPPPSAPPQT